MAKDETHDDQTDETHDDQTRAVEKMRPGWKVFRSTGRNPWLYAAQPGRTVFAEKLPELERRIDKEERKRKKRS